jgi:nucleoside-diphosphate-sugar epimerase
MKKILVTGGLGFIGHKVVHRLLPNHQVTVIDNKTNYGSLPLNQMEWLFNERTKRISNAHFNVPNDISNNIIVDYIFDKVKPDIVIHLASFPNQELVNKKPSLASHTMLTGLINLCEASKRINLSKFVYISSSMVYGDFNDGVKEDHECNPKGLYGIMKLTGEKIVQDYHRRAYFHDYTIIRPSAVYGPLDTGNRVVAKFIHSAMLGGPLRVRGSGEKLDFTYVDDTANGIAKAAISDNTTNKTYNLSRGKSRTILETAEIITNLVGKGKIEISEKDLSFPSRGSLDISKAKFDFDYNPKIDIEQGLMQYYAWYKENSTFWS